MNTESNRGWLVIKHLLNSAKIVTNLPLKFSLYFDQWIFVPGEFSPGVCVGGGIDRATLIGLYKHSFFTSMVVDSIHITSAY